MNFLGIDLSLTSTGYCFSDNCDTISSSLKGPQRLINISESIGNLIIEFKIDVVILEGYSFASRNSQAHSIGELGGVVRVMLYKMDIPYVQVPPTCRAKFATGKGNASKNEVISSVSARTGIVWKNPGADDKCDAWVLEEMALTKIGRQRHQWPKANLDALSNVDWSVIDELEKERKAK